MRSQDDVSVERRVGCRRPALLAASAQNVAAWRMAEVVIAK